MPDLSEPARTCIGCGADIWPTRPTAHAGALCAACQVNTPELAAINRDGSSVSGYRKRERTHEERLNSIEDMVSEIRESQLRTEALVKDFIENMSKNPMMKMMAGRFGG